MRPLRPALVAGVALAAIATVLTGPSNAAPPASTIAWTACGERLECGTVRAPLDWKHPGGRKISLAVIRHLASQPEKKIGSLFVNPGGPGDSGIEDITARGAALDALTAGRFDVVSWDLRGSGRSTPVSCFADDTSRDAFWQGRTVPFTATEEARYLPKTVELARRCGARNGELLRYLGITDMAHDLEVLRQAVGDPKLNYLGESNGTLLGQAYANFFPAKVRAMSLDGVVDPTVYQRGIEAALAESLTDADALFGEFLAHCERVGPQGCALAGHGPVATRVTTALNSLRRTPIPAPGATPPGSLTYADALTGLKLGVLPDPATWPEAAQVLELAIQGDGSILLDIARQYADERFHRVLEPGMTMTCVDAVARQEPKAWPRVVDGLERVSRYGGAVMGWLIGAPCASWPVRAANPNTGPMNATTPNPILFVGTRLDPNSPLVSAQRSARRMGNTALLVHDGYGHLTKADPSACVQRAIGNYLVRLAVPRKGTVCASDRLPFDPAFGRPLP